MESMMRTGLLSAGPHTLLWLVSLNEALWRLVRGFFCCWATIRKTVLQFYVCKKKIKNEPIHLFFFLRGNRCFEGFKLRRKRNGRADVSFHHVGFIYLYCARLVFFFFNCFLWLELFLSSPWLCWEEYTTYVVIPLIFHSVKWWILNS